MFIESFSLKNFQSHKDSLLIFSPGLNVIIGPTNSGKSAIIRGLKKVFTDTPKGLDFVTYNQNECFLKLKLGGSPASISRSLKHRNGTLTHNEYSIHSDSFSFSGSLEFFNFGTEIPPEIRNALCNREAVLIEELDDIRFWNQLDSPFLLSLTPSNRARIISRISGVDILDKGAQFVNREAKSQSRVLQDLVQQISKTEQELEKFKDLPAWEEKLVQIKIGVDKVKNLWDRKEKVISIFEKLKSLTQQINDLQLFLQTKAKSFTELQSLYSQLKTLGEKISLKKRARDLSIRLRSLSLQQKVLEDFVYLSMQFNFKAKMAELLDKKNRYRTILNLQTKYRTVAEAVIAAKNSLENAVGSLQNSVQELQTLKIELKVCPVCGKAF